MFRPKLIKYSVQGSITILSGNLTGTFTIPQAVVLANTLLKWGGWNADSLGSFNIESATLDITGTTTVTATRQSAVGYDLIIKFTINEYYSGIIRNLQRGTIAIITGNFSNTATLTRNTNFNYGLEYLGAQADINNEVSLSLAGTTLTAAVSAAVVSAPSCSIGYQYYEM